MRVALPRAGLALLLLLLWAAPAAAAPECPAGARCGAIRVPVDRAGTVPGTFPVSWALLPATGPRQGTIVFLAGGPGESAIIYTADVKTVLAPLRATHDIVLVDQRGTGRSGEIDCQDALEDVELELGEGCARLVGDRRAFLTTKETARDLDDVRAALGVDRIIPLGVSYGTKVAGEYARRFPDRTAAVVLDSPVGVGPIDLLFLEGIRAAPRILREACATGPCARTVADPAAALYGGVARVQARPVGGVHERDVLAALRNGDGEPGLRADLPAALASLARGDAAPLAHLLQRPSGGRAPEFDPATEDDVGFSVSRYLATACLESALPWAPTSAPASRPAAARAFLRTAVTAPFRPRSVYRRSAFELCETWPATPAPEPVPDAGPDVPALVLSGRADLRTPLELATRVAADYPRATLVDVPHVGHSVLAADPSGCAVRGLRAFLAGAAPGRCTAPREVPAAGYLPASARGLSARAVARLTVAGLLHDLAVAGRPYELRGLRGGYATVRGRRLTLRRVRWFRGVQVSGTVSRAGRGRVTVRGLGGPPRTVKL
jgi:pimeloyl-ACP methyl ester carboxylesterase